MGGSEGSVQRDRLHKSVALSSNVSCTIQSQRVVILCAPIVRVIGESVAVEIQGLLHLACAQKLIGLVDFDACYILFDGLGFFLLEDLQLLVGLILLS